MKDLVPFSFDRHSLSRSVFDEMDKLFDKVFGKEFFPHAIQRSSYPKMNIYVDDSKLHLDVYIPEVSKENLSLEIDENNILTISGKANKSMELEKKDYYCKEVSERAFSRSVQLPEDVETDKIITLHKDGMLRITVPYKSDKVERSKVKKIDIK